MKRNNPFKGTKRILVPTQQWRETHPHRLVCKSDSYYAQLASRLATLMKEEWGNVLELSDEDYRLTGLDLAAYLEDKVTGMNIWNSFIALCREKAGVAYPFYPTEGEEMYDDEPNFQDVRFLVWRGINQADDESILNPMNEAVKMIAESLFEVLEEEFEVAPESPEFHAALYAPALYSDVMHVRNCCQWVVSNSYLYRSQHLEDNLERIHDAFGMFFDDAPAELIAYVFGCYLSLNTKTGPLALYPWEWLSKMMELSADGRCNEVSVKLKEMKSVSLLPNYVKEKDATGVTAETMSGSVVRVSYATLRRESVDDFKVGYVFLASLFYYDGVWNVNGTCSFSQSGEMFRDTKAEFLEKKRHQEDAYAYQMKQTDGKRIGVAANWEELDRIFGLDKVADKSPDHALRDRVRKEKKLLYFIEKDGSSAILPDAAECVALPGNPYYDPEIATREAASIIMEDETSAELRSYLIEHRLLPDARMKGSLPDEEAKSWFAENAELLNRYCHTDRVEFNFPE